MRARLVRHARFPARRQLAARSFSLPAALGQRQGHLSRSSHMIGEIFSRIVDGSKLKIALSSFFWGARRAFVLVSQAPTATPAPAATSAAHSHPHAAEKEAGQRASAGTGPRARLGARAGGATCNLRPFAPGGLRGPA